MMMESRQSSSLMTACIHDGSLVSSAYPIASESCALTHFYRQSEYGHVPNARLVEVILQRLRIVH